MVNAPVLPPSTDLTASAFERRFAQQLGNGVNASAFWKGRVAFFAILRALGVGPGHEVIVPGFTCVVVPNAVRLAGAAPIYADVEPGGYNLDPRRAAEIVSPRTRAVVIQHSFGIPAQIDALLDLAGSMICSSSRTAPTRWAASTPAGAWAPWGTPRSSAFSGRSP